MGGSFILHVHAGRWIVLCFLGSANNPRVNEELAEPLHEASLFDEDRLIVRAVFTAPPDDVAKYPEVRTKALSFLADYDGAISAAILLWSFPSSASSSLVRASGDYFRR